MNGPDDNEELTDGEKMIYRSLEAMERERDVWKARFEACDQERSGLREKLKLALDFIRSTDALVEHEEKCPTCLARGSCGKDERKALEATVLLTQKALAQSIETRKIERKGKA